jgi:hypothetical protein
MPQINHWKTPKTIPELEKMLKAVQTGRVTDEDHLELIQKIGNVASNAMVALRATQSINKELGEKSKEKEKRKDNRDGGDYGKARVMGPEELQRREQYALDKAFEEAAIPFFAPLSVDIFTIDIYTKTTRPLSPAKQNRLFHQAVKPLFNHLTPELFASTQSQRATSAQVPVKTSKAEKALETVKKTALRPQKKTQQTVIEKLQMKAVIVQTRSGRSCTQIRTIRTR